LKPAPSGGQGFSLSNRKTLYNKNVCANLLPMKLTAQVKLVASLEQTASLKKTLVQANAACNFVSQRAFECQVFGKYALQKLTYAEVRSTFGLSAQMAVRVIAKVAGAYRLDKKTPRRFNPTGAIAYDARILSWNMAGQVVSIWTVDGRIKIPFRVGKHHEPLLGHQHGESDLMLWRDGFFLNTVCTVDEPPQAEVEGVLGVDLGITNIATDSDGQMHSGQAIKHVRHRHRRLRAKLQSKGTKSAKRRLKKLSGKERRFAKWVNHTLSKRIVAKAKDTHRAIALENLKNIRTRITVRRPQRATLHSWSFFQLRSFVAYKARLQGVPMHLVDPRNTSRQCHACGCIAKRNRPNQHTFLCVSCGHAAHADLNAARNIASRAARKPAERLAVPPECNSVASGGFQPQGQSLAL
jgi:IS605 OrfB family transposase